jgi:hypothetical protein
MSEFLAATSNSLRAVEIVANDTIVVAGLVSATAFGNCVCARADGDGRFARAGGGGAGGACVRDFRRQPARASSIRAERRPLRSIGANPGKTKAVWVSP